MNTTIKILALKDILEKKNRLFVRFQTKKRYITGLLQKMYLHSEGKIRCVFSENGKSRIDTIKESELSDIVIFTDAKFNQYIIDYCKNIADCENTEVDDFLENNFRPFINDLKNYIKTNGDKAKTVVLNIINNPGRANEIYDDEDAPKSLRLIAKLVWENNNNEPMYNIM